MSRLSRCRNIDVGDVSPADYERFTSALRADVDGVQVDFDDGHCPSWSNNIRGYRNINKFVTGELGQSLRSSPVLMLRPRAWNMTERNVLVEGKASPAPLVDFGILVWQNANQMNSAGAGPFFYLRAEWRKWFLINIFCYWKIY